MLEALSSGILGLAACTEADPTEPAPMYYYYFYFYYYYYYYFLCPEVLHSPGTEAFA